MLVTRHRTYETLAQAAERTGLSVKTLRRRISEGHLQAYTSGRRVLRVDPLDVDQMMTPIWPRMTLRARGA